MTVNLRSFWSDESGAELVEWAAVVVLLLVASVVGLVAVRGLLIDTIWDVFLQMRKAPPDTY